MPSLATVLRCYFFRYEGLGIRVVLQFGDLGVVVYAINMFNRLYHHIRRIFDTPSIEEIAAYQHKIPGSIYVNTSYDEKTKFYTATITSLDKKKITALLITESRDAVLNQIGRASCRERV